MWLIMCLFIDSLLVELKSQEFNGHSDSSTVSDVFVMGATVNEKMVTPYNGPAAKLLTLPTLTLVKMTIKPTKVNPGTSCKSYLTPI